MSGTFNGCSSLTGITNIPTGVTDISSAFTNCTSLVSVPTIPDSATYMNGTFYGCSSLEEITLNNKPTMNNYTFRGCPTTLKIYVSDSLVDYYKSNEYTKNFTILPIENNS